MGPYIISYHKSYIYSWINWWSNYTKVISNIFWSLIICLNIFFKQKYTKVKMWRVAAFLLYIYIYILQCGGLQIYVNNFHILNVVNNCFCISVSFYSNDSNSCNPLPVNHTANKPCIVPWLTQGSVKGWGLWHSSGMSASCLLIPVALNMSGCTEISIIL